MKNDIYFEILSLFGKYTSFKIVLYTFLCFNKAIRNFTDYSQYFDKKSKCSFSSCIALELCSMPNVINEAIDKTLQA